jgi:hypothetical protein
MSFMQRATRAVLGKQGPRERKVRIGPEGDTASLSAHIMLRLGNDGI